MEKGQVKVIYEVSIKACLGKMSMNVQRSLSYWPCFSMKIVSDILTDKKKDKTLSWYRTAPRVPIDLYFMFVFRFG